MSHFSFFQHVLKNYDGNIFEKTLPEMNAEHQFKMVRCIIFNILNEKRISMIQSQVGVKTTMRINLVSLFKQLR